MPESLSDFETAVEEGNRWHLERDPFRFLWMMKELNL
jgi:hypothetical protein